MNTLTQQQINQYQWQVADGVARVVNPFDSEYKNKTVREIGGFGKAAAVSKNYAAFEKKFGNICFTSNAPDGIYSGEAFELVWQYNYFGSSYIDVTDDCYEQYNHDYDKWAKPTDIAVRCRQFLRLKPSHLPAVLTTQPGEEWKDRYRETHLVSSKLEPCWFAGDDSDNFKSDVWEHKREWHLNTPPAEQEDWYCPKCKDYLCSEQVTFDETHQTCGTEVTVGKPAEHEAEPSSQAMMQKAQAYFDKYGEMFSKQAFYIAGYVQCEQDTHSTLTQKDQRIAELEREREYLKGLIIQVRTPFYGLNQNTFQAQIVRSLFEKLNAVTPTPPQH